MADTSQMRLAVQQSHLAQEQQASTSVREPRVEERYPLKDNSAPLDFSFMHLTCVEDAEKEEPRVPVLSGLASPRDDSGKFDGRCLRLNNNLLPDTKMLKNVTGKLFNNPANIGWLDFSFNALTTIDEEILEFANLEILYLHGNNIANLKEVDKLTKLTRLKKLTLHGNPIEKDKTYRMYVLSCMPWLRSFDFSCITKCDARTAQTWKRINNPDKKKKKVKSDDD